MPVRTPARRARSILTSRSRISRRAAGSTKGAKVDHAAAKDLFSETRRLAEDHVGLTCTRDIGSPDHDI